MTKTQKEHQNIRIKVGTNTSITIKRYLLDLVTKGATNNPISTYENNKQHINSIIQTKYKQDFPEGNNFQGNKSSLITQWLIEFCIQSSFKQGQTNA